jgi:hypothetical protein
VSRNERNCKQIYHEKTRRSFKVELKEEKSREKVFREFLLKSQNRKIKVEKSSSDAKDGN